MFFKNKKYARMNKKKEELMQNEIQYVDINKTEIALSSKIISGQSGSGKTYYFLNELDYLLEENIDMTYIIFNPFNEYDNLFKKYGKESVKVDIQNIDFFKENDLNTFKNKVIYYTYEEIYDYNETLKTRKYIQKILNDLFILIKNNKDLKIYLLLDDIECFLDDVLIQHINDLFLNRVYENCIINMTNLHYNQFYNLKFETKAPILIYQQITCNDIISIQNNCLHPYIGILKQLDRSHYLINKENEYYVFIDDDKYIDITKK